jgi:Family of unknown function (DUF5340)
MNPLPLPSHIHYELLLQLLEKQSLFAVDHQSQQRDQIHQLIMTLRKALVQQKQLEEECERMNLPIEYRWSLTRIETPPDLDR